jgi:succinate dehydrogenase/fumarate reductase flavoprotein subunit
MIEIREGRGCDGPWGPHAKLKLDHLGKEVLEGHFGRNTAHHVVAGWDNRDRLFHRIDVSKGTGQTW